MSTQQLGLLEDAPAVDPRPVNTAPWKEYAGVTLYHGDCIDILRAMPANSVDAIASDPPYGLGYMGKEWDSFRPGAAEARIVENKAIESDNPNLRGRTRGPASSPSAVEYDRTIEGQRGFQAFTEAWAREAIRVLKPGGHALVCGAPRSAHRMVSGIEDAGFEIRDSIAWLFGQGFPKSHNLRDDDGLKNGWGTALKPGHEPICLARKPLRSDVGTTVDVWGVGAMNIDATRLEGDRWPANVALDEYVAAQLAKVERFFFCPKPSRRERDFGCEDLPVMTPGECTERKEGSAGITPYAGAGRSGGGRNFHPTVKPVALMRWLVRLVTPPGGTVLDPFLGSGTTGMAALLEGNQFIGVDKEQKYLQLADARISATWREVHQ